MNKYLKLLETYSGEIEDCVYELFSMLKEDEKGIDGFIELCGNIGFVDSDESVAIMQHYAEGELEQLKDLYAGYIDELLNSIIMKAIIEKQNKRECYKCIYESIMDSNILTSDKEKSFGLLWIFMDDKIPLYDLDAPLSMDNKEYQELLKRNKEGIGKIKFILSVPFKQRTEVASALLHEIFLYDDFKEQTVVLSHALNIYLKNHLKGMKGFIAEIEKTKENK